MKLIVLLSSYNGEKYIGEQLDSLLNQDLKPDKIFIRDDGSTDETVNILEDYSSRFSCIQYYCGKNVGVAKSFMELINNCEDADYYALCDQDDYWLKDKLSSAVELLEKKNKNIPLLYCSKFTLTDENLNPIDSDVSKLYNFSDFDHSLIYHTAPGCTFVFNHELRKLIKMYDVNENYILIHDALIHKIATLFGEMILDENSHIYYRQHQSNQIGMTANAFETFKGRIERFVKGSIRNYRSKSASSLIDVYGDICDKDKLKTMKMVAYYRDDKELKKQFMEYDGFKSDSVNDIFLKILILVNYI